MQRIKAKTTTCFLQKYNFLGFHLPCSRQKNTAKASITNWAASLMAYKQKKVRILFYVTSRFPIASIKSLRLMGFSITKLQPDSLKSLAWKLKL